ncbi:MAG: arylsulfatase, partial [bacterium]
MLPNPANNRLLRIPLTAFVAFLSLPGVAVAFAQAAASKALPNVVVFLADDAGWGDYSCSGNTQLQTPAIDSISKTGVS